MPVRVHYRLLITVSSTSAEERDLGNVSYEIIDDVQGEGGTWKSTVPATSVDVPVNLGNLAECRFLVVRTTAKDPSMAPVEILLRRNLITAEQISIKPLGVTKEGHLVLSTQGLTALFATNASSGVDMDLTVVAAGD